MSFQSTLDRVIVARASFGTKLEQYGSSMDAEVDAKHENFVDGKTLCIYPAGNRI